MLRWTLVALFSIIVAMAQAQLREVSLQELYGQEKSFTPASVSYPYGLKDGKRYTTLEPQRGIITFSFATGKELGVMLAFDRLPDSLRRVEAYAFSADERYLLLETKRQPIYRRSYFANFWIYDLKSDKLRPLSAAGKERLATFAPDGSKIAFLRDNNLFYYDIASEKETQVTTDGQRNQVINGAADWVYEEEFAMATALSWSPDSRYIAYLRFDERNVREYSMLYYDSTLYPQVYRYKYPKAGEQNSLVSLHVYDANLHKTVRVQTGDETDQYIPRVRWSPSGALCYLRENRLQNHLEILEANPETGVSRLVLEEKDACYIEEPTDWYLTFLGDGKRFIIPSERSGYRQLYLCDWESKIPPQPITTGEDEILEVYGYSQKTDRLYYRAYDESPLRTAIFSVKLDGSKKVRMSHLRGTNSAWFNSALTYYIQTYSSLQTVPQISLHSIDGKQLRLLEDNKALQNKLREYQLPEKRFFTFQTPDGTTLNGYMVLPIGFDSMMSYPTMMYQYSGPNSQTVLDRWTLGWDQFLASRGCIVVCVDGRGTGGRGAAFRKCTYGQLGNLESKDQIAAAEYIASLAFVDAKRIGIWGWSFGGYMSLLCKFRGGDLYKMCVAVAPVTNWRFYDSVYTERFMGLPSTNAKGYDDNSPLHFTSLFKEGLLLMHGTFDDNVHIQHAMRLTEKLIAEGKAFEMQLYPDRNHGIYGGGATLHLYERMWEYITRQLM